MPAAFEKLWRPLKSRRDARGLISIAESDSELPFVPRRLYCITGTPADAVRGRHAHFRLNQLLLPVSGACTVDLDDGTHRASLRLEDPTKALLVPPFMWHVLRAFTPDCSLVVLADEVYDAADYIHDPAEFARITAMRRGAP